VQVMHAQGPGNLVLVTIESQNVTEVLTAFGQKGIPAETVAQAVAVAARDYLIADVPVGPHLADQLLIPLALAGGGSFRTVTPTQHTRTNAAVIERFLDVVIVFTDDGRRAWRVDVASRGVGATGPGGPQQPVG
jgi:RNA 3'-terminal phosphate cyclase (ATP)